MEGGRHRPPAPWRPFETVEHHKLPGFCAAPRTSEQGGYRTPERRTTKNSSCGRSVEGRGSVQVEIAAETGSLSVICGQFLRKAAHIQRTGHVLESNRTETERWATQRETEADVPPLICWVGRHTRPAGCAGLGCSCRTVQLWSGSPPVQSQQGWGGQTNHQQSGQTCTVLSVLISSISTFSSADSASF